MTRSVPLITKEPGRRHERQFAHVDFLFFHFFDDRFWLEILYRESPNAPLHAKAKQSQTAQLTFLDVKRLDRLKRRKEILNERTIVRHDRKYRSEGRLQALFYVTEGAALLARNFDMTRAGRQQERNVVDVGAFRKDLRMRFFSVNE